MARRDPGRSGDLLAVCDRETADRAVSGQGRFRLDVWRRRVGGRVRRVGVLLQPDLFPGSRVHEDFRDPVRVPAGSPSAGDGDGAGAGNTAIDATSILI